MSRADDKVALWSSRGPTYLDNEVKPDFVAPGTGIHSLYSPGTYLARTYPERQSSGSGQTALFRLSGTSMSAAAALRRGGAGARERTRG